MNETLKVLKERRSVRKYKAEQIRDEELNAILEAGTWAPSAKGLQTSVMVVVQDPETIAWMSKLNAEIQGNPGTDPFYGAPTVVVVLGDGEKLNWLQDGSLVMGNLMTAAAALGLGSCWINRAMEAGGQGTAEEVGAAGDLPWCGQLHPGVCGGGPARPQAPEGRLDPPRVTDTQGGGSIPAALLFCCGSPWRIVCNRFIW